MTSYQNLDFDERCRIIILYQRGRSIPQIAEKLNLSRNTVRKWIHRFEKRGNLNELPRGGNKHRVKDVTVKNDTKGTEDSVPRENELIEARLKAAVPGVENSTKLSVTKDGKKRRREAKTAGGKSRKEGPKSNSSNRQNSDGTKLGLADDSNGSNDKDMSINSMDVEQANSEMGGSNHEIGEMDPTIAELNNKIGEVNTKIGQANAKKRQTITKTRQVYTKRVRVRKTNSEVNANTKVCENVTPNITNLEERGEIILNDPKFEIQADRITPQQNLAISSQENSTPGDAIYRCSMCNKEIRGICYACLQCAASGLCALCEGRAHPAHYVLRLPAAPQGEAAAVLSALRDSLHHALATFEQMIVPPRPPTVPEIKDEMTDPLEQVNHVAPLGAAMMEETMLDFNVVPKTEIDSVPNPNLEAYSSHLLATSSHLQNTSNHFQATFNHPQVPLNQFQATLNHLQVPSNQFQATSNPLQLLLPTSNLLIQNQPCFVIYGNQSGGLLNNSASQVHSTMNLSVPTVDPSQAQYTQVAVTPRQEDNLNLRNASLSQLYQAGKQSITTSIIQSDSSTALLKGVKIEATSRELILD